MVKATPETIWRVPAYLPYIQPPLTKKLVASAEKEIGYKLPAELLAVLTTQNGGYIRFSLPDMVHSCISGIGPHFPSLTDFDWSDRQEHVSYSLDGLVPFDGDGHWHICLDYRRKRTTPAIAYVDVECDRQTRVADSFADYLAMLQIRADGEVILEGISEFAKFKAKFESLIEAKFDQPDTWAHGYPTHRANIGTATRPKWLWISPNTVPRGFVRSDDPRYKELKHLMPGSAERFPEVPAGSHILTAGGSLPSRILDACRRLGVQMHTLSEYID